MGIQEARIFEDCCKGSTFLRIVIPNPELAEGEESAFFSLRVALQGYMDPSLRFGM